MLRLKNVSKEAVGLKYDSKIFTVKAGDSIDMPDVHPGATPVMEVALAERFEMANPGKFERVTVVLEKKVVDKTPPPTTPGGIASGPGPDAKPEKTEGKKTRKRK